MDVRRNGDRILIIILNRDIFNIIITYALHVGFNESKKRQFWVNLDKDDIGNIH